MNGPLLKVLNIRFGQTSHKSSHDIRIHIQFRQVVDVGLLFRSCNTYLCIIRHFVVEEKILGFFFAKSLTLIDQELLQFNSTLTMLIYNSNFTNT